MSWPPTSLNDTQLANARIIAQVGRGLGASDRDVTIALMTALQESEMLNMKGGDRDSTGLFQQRNAWGSYADRMDPYKSAAMFFTGGQGGQRGLLDFKARDQMSLTQAAQAVQVSAYPDAYAKWAPLVSKYLPDVAGGSGAVSSTGTAASTAHTVTSANTNTPQSLPAPTGLSENTTTPIPVQAPPLLAPAGLAPTAPAGLEGAAPAGLDGAAPAGVSSGMAPPVQPAQPSDSGLMTPEAFHATFPDAAATKMFSGAGSKLGMARRTDAVTTAMSYLGTPYSWGGNSRSGVDCIAEGSLVATCRGEVPIERVEPGDWVMTRSGWRMVSRAWLVGTAEVVEIQVEGHTLRATPDHRVWTENHGWIPVACITALDALVLCRSRSASDSTGEPTSATPTPRAPLTGPTSRTARARSTGLSGSTLTAPCPPGSRYTTWTTTPSTTTSPTWLSSPFPNIAGRVLRHASSTNSFVPNAGSCSAPSPTRAPSGGSAAPSTSGTASTVSVGSGTSRVYDLTVEGEHEFFAGGVLVHNCSGLVQQTYAAMGISLPRLSSDQIRSGQRVSFDQLKPGDLVGWDNSSSNNGADHIALYAGNGRIVEAPRPGIAVRTRNLSQHEIDTAMTAHFRQLD